MSIDLLRTWLRQAPSQRDPAASLSLSSALELALRHYRFDELVPLPLTAKPRSQQ